MKHASCKAGVDIKCLTGPQVSPITPFPPPLALSSLSPTPLPSYLQLQHKEHRTCEVHIAHVTMHTAVQEKETQSGDRPFRLLERSVFSDRMVFVRAVHEKSWMSDLELNIYDSWYVAVGVHCCNITAM